MKATMLQLIAGVGQRPLTLCLLPLVEQLRGFTEAAAVLDRPAALLSSLRQYSDNTACERTTFCFRSSVPRILPRARLCPHQMSSSIRRPSRCLTPGTFWLQKAPCSGFVSGKEPEALTSFSQSNLQETPELLEKARGQISLS